MAIGTKIYISASLPNECKRFTLDLQRGTGEEADIFLHFNVRFAEAVVVRNSRQASVWGPEEHEGTIPFTAAHPFLVVVSASIDSLEVEVNGNLFTTFKLRDGMPITNITHLSIYGDVIVSAIHIPLETFPKHLRLGIPDKTKVGDVFALRGRVPAGCDRFVVNLQCGSGQSDDVVFHFNPRMDDGYVVRNTRSDEQWAEEETAGGIPFACGEPFHLMIGTGSDAYRTWVNGQEFINFGHRMDMRNACILYVEGEADFEDIAIDSIASRLPSQSEDNSVRNFQKSDVQLFNPPMPVSHRIPNGMAPGRVVAISGTVNKDANRFGINLQCDAGSESDITYHYNPRFEDGVVVQNSRDGDWHEEVRNTDEFPFVPGSPFDLQILCTPSGGYFVAVNGVANATYPSRMDCTRADHLYIEGDVQIQRVFVL